MGLRVRGAPLQFPIYGGGVNVTLPAISFTISRASGPPIDARSVPRHPPLCVLVDLIVMAVHACLDGVKNLVLLCIGQEMFVLN